MCVSGPLNTCTGAFIVAKRFSGYSDSSGSSDTSDSSGSSGSSGF